MSDKKRESGMTTIEMVVVLALFGIVLVSLMGLHFVAISAGTAAETSSIAASLARARMEELLALPRNQLKGQDNAERIQSVGAGGGRPYTVRTQIAAPDPARLDLTVTVTWQPGFAGACAGRACAGSRVTFTRTLETRVQVPPRL